MKNYTNLDQMIAGLRHEYSLSSLEQRDLAYDPYRQFTKWFEAARRKKARYLNVMSLATAAARGKASARIVLLKGFSRKGFVFYTHYDSRKAREIQQSRFGEIVFYWQELERQVRIAGRIVKTSRQESVRYFAQRPRAAQISAWVSHQSRPVESRTVLEKIYHAIEIEFRSRKIPCPRHWGGFRLEPRSYEFWQGRANRLNDRFLFTKSKSVWKVERLQP